MPLQTTAKTSNYWCQSRDIYKHTYNIKQYIMTIIGGDGTGGDGGGETQLRDNAR